METVILGHAGDQTQRTEADIMRASPAAADAAPALPWSQHVALQVCRMVIALKLWPMSVDSAVDVGRAVMCSKQVPLTTKSETRRQPAICSVEFRINMLYNRAMLNVHGWAACAENSCSFCTCCPGMNRSL